jgi:ribosomal protein L3 glutamine methyltransferase
MTVLELIKAGERQLLDAGVAFGHGTTNAFDEAAWLVLWQLGLPLDSALADPQNDQNSVANQAVPQDIHAQVATILIARITTRKPAAYLTREAWLQGVPFYVDERTIVPRSLIAEAIADGSIDYWLTESTQRVLDLCTGNGSLAVIAALTFPDTVSHRLRPLQRCAGRGPHQRGQARPAGAHHAAGVRRSACARAAGAGPVRFDSVQPAVCQRRQHGGLARRVPGRTGAGFGGNSGGDGMDFVRQLLVDAPALMAPGSVLVLEIGNERAHFEAAFPSFGSGLAADQCGDDQVLLVTRARHFLAFAQRTLLRGAKPDCVRVPRP